MNIKLTERDSFELCGYFIKTCLENNDKDLNILFNHFFEDGQVKEIRADFFYKAIPAMGYAPDYEHGFWFEYYPNGISGKCELWSPVVKNHV